MFSDSLASAYRFTRQLGYAPPKALALARFDVLNGVKRYTGAPSKVGGYARAATSDSAFYEADKIPLRVVGYSDEIRSQRHRGWYTDDNQSDTLRGVVFQAPGRRGVSRFVAGYEESVSGGYLLDLSRGALFEEPRGDYHAATSDLDAARDAARAADSFAESRAEEAREYDEAWRAGSDWRDEGEAIGEARRAALAILAERRRVKDVAAPVLCAAIRARLDSLLDDIREAREKREKLRESVWPEHYAAFNEGAGAVVFSAGV